MAFAVIVIFFASLQWLFQQRKPADAYSDTQASDHGLAEPVEAPQDSEKSDYEWVEDTDDQNFAALKHILQAPLHEAEEMSKEDKQNKLESKSDEMECNEKKVKDDDMEKKNKQKEAETRTPPAKRKASEKPWRMDMKKVPEPEKLPPLPPPATPHPDVLRASSSSSKAAVVEEPLSAEELLHYKQVRAKTDKKHRSGGINKAVVLARAYMKKDWEKCNKLVEAHPD